MAENRVEPGGNIIDIKHVSKWFGDKQVLDDVSLYIRKGEFVTILGPSGCGKTTLLKIAMGLIPDIRRVPKMRIRKPGWEGRR